MKVFISWSGPRARQVANILHGWLPSVIQGVESWVSTKDLDKGVRWGAELTEELENTSFGIICVTKDNVAAPWLNFEAGALSKQVVGAKSDGRVIPFLFGLEPSDITGSPLSDFQQAIYHEKYDRKKEVFDLLRSINSVSVVPLSEEKLRAAFEKWWVDLSTALAELEHASSENNADDETKSSSVTDTAIEEILRLSREHNRLLNVLNDPDYFAKMISNGKTKVVPSTARRK